MEPEELGLHPKRLGDVARPQAGRNVRGKRGRSSPVFSLMACWGGGGSRVTVEGMASWERERCHGRRGPQATFATFLRTQ